MRVVALHPDVIVVLSAVWQTSCTAVRAGEEGFVIDSPILPDELDALEGLLQQAGFPVSGLLVTHGDWDHVLGAFAFPEASLGCAESTAERLGREAGGARAGLDGFDGEHYVERPHPLELPDAQALPVPGRLELGPERELELHPAPGHTADGMSIWIPWARVLVCGDYVSPVEIPMISPGGSPERYGETLRRLRELAAGAESIVPGHGAPLTRDAALRVLDEDMAYLDALTRDGDRTPLPSGRATDAQRRIHERNLAALGSAGSPV